MAALMTIADRTLAALYGLPVWRVAYSLVAELCLGRNQNAMLE